MDSQPDSLVTRHQNALRNLNKTPKFTDEWLRLKVQEISLRRELDSKGSSRDDEEKSHSSDEDNIHLQSDDSSGHDNRISKSRDKFADSTVEENPLTTLGEDYILTGLTALPPEEPLDPIIQRSVESSNSTPSIHESEEVPEPVSISRFADDDVPFTDRDTSCDSSDLTLLPQGVSLVPSVPHSFKKYQSKPVVLEADRAPVPFSMSRFAKCTEADLRSSNLILIRDKAKDTRVLISESYYIDCLEGNMAEATEYHHHDDDQEISQQTQISHTPMGSSNGLHTMNPNVINQGPGLLMSSSRALSQSASNNLSIDERSSQIPQIELSNYDEDEVIHVPVAFRVEEDPEIQEAMIVETHEQDMISMLKRAFCVNTLIFTVIVITIAIAVPVSLKNRIPSTNTDNPTNKNNGSISPSSSSSQPSLHPARNVESAESSFCGCSTCTQEVWDSGAPNGSKTHSCGSRITWLQEILGSSEQDSCSTVAGEFPEICTCSCTGAENEDNDAISPTSSSQPSLHPTRNVNTTTAESSFCGCSTCTQEVWDSNLPNGSTFPSCGSRITWLQESEGYSKHGACNSVTRAFPEICTCSCTGA